MPYLYIYQRHLCNPASSAAGIDIGLFWLGMSDGMFLPPLVLFS